MEQVWKTTGKKPAELEAQEEFPNELIYIWEWYLEVRNGEILTYTELRNWSKLMCINVLAWEVELLKALDRIYWRTLSG